MATTRDRRLKWKRISDCFCSSPEIFETAFPIAKNIKSKELQLRIVRHLYTENQLISTSFMNMIDYLSFLLMKLSLPLITIIAIDKSIGTSWFVFYFLGIHVD